MTYIPGKFDWKKANALNGYSGVKEAMGDFNSELKNTIDKGKGFAKDPFSKIKADWKPGLRIKIGTKNEYKYYTPEMECVDDGSFFSMVIDSLNYVYENGTEYFKTAIDSISKNTVFSFTIKESSVFSKESTLFKPDMEPNYYIVFNPYCSVVAKNIGNNNQYNIPPYISLAHEIAHAYNYLQLEIDLKKAKKDKNRELFDEIDTKQLDFFKTNSVTSNEEEASTTTKEKELCVKLGLAYRNFYFDVKGITKVVSPFNIAEAERTPKENKEIEKFNERF